MNGMKVAFLSSDTKQAILAKKELVSRYGDNPIDACDIIVALGGDGFMLHTLHKFIESNIPIYGMNCGSIGFLMNEYDAENLEDKLKDSEITNINPLRMIVSDINNVEHNEIAINEVALSRTTHQAAKLQISINNQVRLGELVSDGLLVSTPAGSTAYNLSADGPILPLNAKLIALTPTSPFRPRRWKGALINIDSIIEIDVLEPKYRTVNATADSHEIHNAKKIKIFNDTSITIKIMFDQNYNLDERITREQFMS
tara:strand:+ start:2352 stop:3119 length:768 start_codon:yes stop_codon:yes gene_type:complete